MSAEPSIHLSKEEELHEPHLRKLSAIEVVQEVETLKQFSLESVQQLWSSNAFPAELDYAEFGRFLHTLLEVPGESDTAKRMFALADANKNGKVDLKEMVALLTVISVGQEEEKLVAMFDLFDLNGDGMISQKEFSDVADTFWTYSKAMGLVRFAAEEARIFGAQVFAKRVFSDLDKNSDGFITREEFKSVVNRYMRFGEPSAIMETQTGGHVGAFKFADPGQLMKKVGKAEKTFYAETLHTIPGLAPFCPKFFRIHEENGEFHVVMEDLCRDYEKPCILDLKLGTSSIGEDATPAKREEMRKKDEGSTTISLGVRFTGMRVWNEATKEFDRYNKSWGRALTDDQFDEGLLKFFGEGQKPTELIGRFLAHLKNLDAWISNQSYVRFYSSSILFIYDGADRAKEERCKMIDFAHVFPINDDGKDDGYIFGLKNLIARFEKLLN